MNERTDENGTRKALHKRLRALKKWPREGLLLFACLKNLCWNTKTKIPLKNWTRCKTAWKIFENERRRQENWDIPAAELNGHISEFIISVRTKDGNEYKPTSLQSLMASFERQLKKKGYSASIINNLVLEKTRNVLQSKQKQLKKQRKGNKPKASVALTSEEIELKILYEKGLLSMCSPEALF